MFSTWTLLLLILCFFSLLFAVAWWGSKRANNGRQRPVIYSLALGVQCTSWAFFGTTSQAAQYGWAFVPTYLGIILVFLFAHPLLIKISRLCHQHKVSSLADFISLRYGQSLSLGVMVSTLCFFGVVPYIALQLDALTSSFHMVSGNQTQFSEQIGLYVTILMALFAILFGTRTLSLTEKHPGLMLTIAVESVIKLVALVAVGLFVCYQLFDGLFDLLGQAQLHANAKSVVQQDMAWFVYLTHMLLGACSLLCLPRQFHINYIENNGEKELHTARWIFPLYLVGMTLFILPIALAGHIYFADGSVSTDTYVLALPVQAGNEFISLLSLIGGVSASTSMIMVATLALGIMIANSLVTPLFVKWRFRPGIRRQLQPSAVLGIRRVTVLLVLMLAYFYHQGISNSAPLVNSGVISITLLAQFVPLMLLGLYWPRASKRAAKLSLTAGALSWAWWLLWPSIKSSYYFEPVPTDLMLSQGFLYSLGLNLACFVLISALTRRKDHQSQIQLEPVSVTPLSNGVRISSLRAVTSKLLDPAQDAALIKSLSLGAQDGYASPALLSQAEQALASQVGRTSARVLLSAISEKKHVALSGLVELVEEAGQAYQFNHELLQSSVQHIHQGISVIDPNLALIAWNKPYQQMFDYPDHVLKAGASIRELLRYNIERGLLGPVDDIEVEVEKRIAYLHQGSQYKYVRKQGERVIELNGSPLPGGGFVTTYSDISEYMRIQQQLEESKSQLETRVVQRTKELAIAKRQADAANESKSRFLAAAGHDLMQPFNAATLFASMLAQQADSPQMHKLSQGLIQSLNSAEELLNMLLDMTRLESGALTAKPQSFSVDQVLGPLCTEFSVMAKQQSLGLSYIKSQQQVYSDPRLLRRIVQNLLSNALRYTPEGRIVVGVRRRGSELEIQVHDTGIGIAAHQQREIFREFHQLDTPSAQQGLGLGLTIVDRMSRLLQHKVELSSRPDRGTCFKVTLPKAVSQSTDSAHQQGISALAATKAPSPNLEPQFLSGRHILILENDPQIQQAMQAMLSSWGADVTVTGDSKHATVLLSSPPDFMLLDYHLDHGKTGLDEGRKLQQHWQSAIPAIVISADRSEELRQQISELAYYYLPKPLKPMALKGLLKRLLKEN